jgi:hypothetical protein
MSCGNTIWVSSKTTEQSSRGNGGSDDFPAITDCISVIRISWNYPRCVIRSPLGPTRLPVGVRSGKGPGSPWNGMDRWSSVELSLSPMRPDSPVKLLVSLLRGPTKSYTWGSKFVALAPPSLVGRCLTGTFGDTDTDSGSGRVNEGKECKEEISLD